MAARRRHPPAGSIQQHFDSLHGRGARSDDYARRGPLAKIAIGSCASNTDGGSSISSAQDAVLNRRFSIGM